MIFNNLNGLKRALFYVTNCFFILAVGYLLYLYLPLSKSIINYQVNKANFEVASQMTEAEPTPLPVYEYSLNIPEIGATATIVPDISPFNKSQYLEVLSRNVVAQTTGSAMPGGGNGKTTYIFAHSSEEGISMVRNNTVFYLLGNLKKDDQVYISYLGKTYTYQVYDQKIIGANEIKYLNFVDPNAETLILQTCWPIGTDWNRLLIFAKRKQSL